RHGPCVHPWPGLSLPLLGRVRLHVASPRTPCWRCAQATTMPERPARTFSRSVCNERQPKDAFRLVVQVGKGAAPGAAKAFRSPEHVSGPVVTWQLLKRSSQNCPTEVPGEPPA